MAAYLKPISMLIMGVFASDLVPVVLSSNLLVSKPEPRIENHFYRVPDEITLHILKHLPPHDLANLSQTDKKMNALSQDESLWRPHAQNEGIFQKSDKQTWKETYIAHDQALAGLIQAAEVVRSLKLSPIDAETNANVHAVLEKGRKKGGRLDLYRYLLYQRTTLEPITRQGEVVVFPQGTCLVTATLRPALSQAGLMGHVRLRQNAVLEMLVIAQEEGLAVIKTKEGRLVPLAKDDQKMKEIKAQVAFSRAILSFIADVEKSRHPPQTVFER